jgi:hypothetical protein
MHITPNPRLDEVLDALEQHRRRATYGAVAEVVGGIARGVMQGRRRAPRYSWVVRRRDGLPTGYHLTERAPDLLAHPGVITTGAELRALMARP